MKELDTVELVAPLVAEGNQIAAGTTGVIVHKFSDNEFLVEFAQPQCVIGVYSGFLKLVYSHEFRKNTSEAGKG